MKRLPLIFAFVALIVLLGSQFYRTRAPLATMSHPTIEHEARPRPGAAAPTINLPADNSGLVDAMQVAISIVVLGAGLFVVLSKRYEAAEKNWAFGAIGTVIGFWLKV